jgi:hypothetical protein
MDSRFVYYLQDCSITPVLESPLIFPAGLTESEKLAISCRLDMSLKENVFAFRIQIPGKPEAEVAVRGA